MECTWCQSHNPEDQKHCGNCGKPLDPKLAPIKEYLEASLKREISAALSEQLKDQRVVEIETAQAVVTRASEWLKLFGMFLGIPLTLLLFVLAILGFKTFADFQSTVTRAEEDLKKSAAREAEVVKQKSAEMQQEYAALKPQLEKLRLLSAEVDTVTTKVSRIYDTFQILPSAGLTPELGKKIEAELTEYLKYLRRLGFQAEQRQMSVRFLADNDQTGAISYYDPAKNQMNIRASYASRIDFIFREYNHRVLYDSIDFKPNAESDWQFPAIESGLANYLACSFNDDPLFGETNLELPTRGSGPAEKEEPKLVIDLRNTRTFRELLPTFSSAMIDGGEIWGGTFWDFRKQLGKDAADKLIFSAWTTWRPAEAHGDYAKSFAKKLVEAAASVDGGQHQAQFRAVFERRGLKL